MAEVVELRAGAASARLVPAAGGRISVLRLVVPGTQGAVEVLHPYPEDFFDPLRWAKGGIYPLAPYSNRIAQATLRVEGATVALAPHPDAAPHTLHGNAHALPWTLRHSDATTASMVLDAPPSAAWPWHYTAQMDVTLTPSALEVAICMRNADTRSMPAGMGLHPYFRHASGALVGYHATAVWPTTPDFLAQSSRPPRADEVYAPARPLPAGGLTDYVGGWDGQVVVDLPEPGVRLRLQADALFGHLVVHRPDNLASRSPGRPKNDCTPSGGLAQPGLGALTYLCLEPVSHVADGFNLAARGVADTGTHTLAPGESLAGTVRFELLGDNP